MSTFKKFQSYPEREEIMLTIGDYTTIDEDETENDEEETCVGQLPSGPLPVEQGALVICLHASDLV